MWPLRSEARSRRDASRTGTCSQVPEVSAKRPPRAFWRWHSTASARPARRRASRAAPATRAAASGTAWRTSTWWSSTPPRTTASPILSRLQRFDFRRIGPHAIVARLKQVLAAEQLTAEDDALHLIAKSADGGMRDGLSLL